MYCIAVLEDGQWKILDGSTPEESFYEAMASYKLRVRSLGTENVMLLLKRPMNTIVECNLMGSPITPDEKVYVERISDDN